jgi:ribulose-5-phosphate 4-epimerase/fuculose-1-phosphate aldolase
MKLPVRCLISVLVLCLAFLHTTHAAACNRTFTNFTTCTIRNGLAASGDATSMKNTVDMEKNVKLDYDSDKEIVKDGDKAAECQRMHTAFVCMNQAHKPGDVHMGVTKDFYAMPCNAAGTPLLPCSAWCYDFFSKCYPNRIPELCGMTNAAPKGDPVCFGDNGVLGMKALTIIPSAAPALAASTFLAPLALFVAFSVGIS